MSYAATAVAPTSARRHAWIAVLVVGIALFIAIERTLVATQNPNFVPSAILIGAAIVPAAFLTFVLIPKAADPQTTPPQTPPPDPNPCNGPMKRELLCPDLQMSPPYNLTIDRRRAAPWADGVSVRRKEE